MRGVSGMKRKPPSPAKKREMRTAYHDALEAARLDVVRLGALAVDAVHAAVDSLDKRDTMLAARVIAGDDIIDEARRKVEAVCIELIWKQQPVAGELRQVAAMLQTVTDLERIGDYAVDLAKNAIKLNDIALRPAKVEIGKIAAIAAEMLVDAMRAYTESDAVIASCVIAQDDEVDKLYYRGIEALQEEMAADPALVRAGTIMLFVLSTLERVGDRAQNIAWHTKDMLGAGRRGLV
jgi:phosphate transport system protein